VFDGKSYQRVRNTTREIEVQPLPPMREACYLLQAADDTFYCVSRSRFHYTEESLRLYVGDGPKLRELDLIMTILGDGRSLQTFVTAEGTLFISQSSLPSRWVDLTRKLTKLEPSHFIIEESTDESGTNTVTISPR
jgi:hypothetical protein